MDFMTLLWNKGMWFLNQEFTFGQFKIAYMTVFYITIALTITTWTMRWKIVSPNNNGKYPQSKLDKPRREE